LSIVSESQWDLREKQSLEYVGLIALVKGFRFYPELNLHSKCFKQGNSRNKFLLKRKAHSKYYVNNCLEEDLRKQR
jgi:hypothetical protein